MSNKPTTPRAPKELQAAGREFWRSVLSQFDLPDHHDRELLKQCSACLDRIHESQQTIEREGLFVADRFGQAREHPAAATEVTNRRLFKGILRELGLSDSNPAEEYTRPRVAPGRGVRHA